MGGVEFHNRLGGSLQHRHNGSDDDGSSHRHPRGGATGQDHRSAVQNPALLAEADVLGNRLVHALAAGNVEVHQI